MEKKKKFVIAAVDTSYSISNGCESYEGRASPFHPAQSYTNGQTEWSVDSSENEVEIIIVLETSFMELSELFIVLSK